MITLTAGAAGREGAAAAAVLRQSAGATYGSIFYTVKTLTKRKILVEKVGLKA